MEHRTRDGRGAAGTCRAQSEVWLVRCVGELDL